MSQIDEPRIDRCASAGGEDELACGGRPPESADALAAHLDGCPACSAALRAQADADADLLDG